MGEGGRDLWHELSGLADAFADLGRRMLHASRQLHNPGALPADSLIAEVAELRQAFESIREAVRARAMAVSVVEPAAGPPATIKALATLLDAVGEAEAARDAWEARIAPALNLLDRVLRLAHVRDDDFAPLRACQERARALRAAILDGTATDLGEQVDGLAETDHPFAYLVTMIDGADRINDDLWESLFEAVTAAFGKPLAAAVARCRIVTTDVEAPARPIDSLPPVVRSTTESAGPDAGERPPASPPLGSVAVLAAADPEPVEAGSFSVAAAGPTDEPSVALHAAAGPPADEPVLPAMPSVTVEWTTEPVAGPPLAVDGRAPLGSAELSDELLTSVVSEAIPFIPRSLSSLLAARKLARIGRRKSVPKVETLETVRLLSCATISGFVYLDANNDGHFDPNETPIAGDTIRLLNASGTVVGTATTDAHGAYSFTQDESIGLTTKTRTFTASVPDQPTAVSSVVSLPQFDASLGTLTQVDVTVRGSLTSRIRVENLSTSSPATIQASVSGQVSLTSTELGLNLQAPLSSPAGTFDGSTFDGTRDYAGTSGHDFGPQSASFQQTQSLKTQSGDDLSRFIGTGNLSASFAAVATSGATGGGNLASSADSTASSLVSITYYYTPSNCLAPGKYTIVQATEPPGTLNGLVSRDGVVLPLNTTGQPDAIPVTLGDANLPNNDFGELKPADVGGFVYQDLNNNGIKQDGEPGIAGVQVELTGSNDIGPIAPQFATTDSTGAYDFGNLRPGTYTVNLPTQPQGYLDGLDTKGNVTPIPGSDKTDVIPGITVAQGQSAPNNNFGELKPGVVSGFVYQDLNNNGIKQAGEPGIAGVQVELTGSNDLGPVTPEFTTTDSTGAYRFRNLRPGTYSVSLPTQPAGYLDGLDTKGNVTPIPGSDKTDVIPGIALGFDQAATDNNFGELKPADVSGFVYEDRDNNGIKQAGEPGIRGVRVELTGSNDQGQIAPLFTTTDGNGAYDFGLLRPGSYSVQLPTQPAGYFDGLDTKGNVAPIPGSNRTDLIPGIGVGQGESAPDNNFGELRPAGVSGFVYVDLNKNGTKQSNEPGLPGEPIQLTGTDDLGPIAPRFAKTGPDGSYDFENLRPGSYTVRLTQQPAGYLDGLDTKGNVTPIPGSDKTDVIPGIVVSEGQTAPNNNFGELVKPEVPGGGGGGGGPTPCPLPPAEVENVQRLGIHHQRTQFVLTFNTDLDPTSATNLANYRLTVAFRNGRLARREIPLRSAVYNPVAHTVTLTPLYQLNIHFHYQLTVSGVKDACGRPIDGDHNGVPGGDFVTIVTRQNYSPLVPAGPGPAALKVAGWAHRFPRLAAERLASQRKGTPA